MLALIHKSDALKVLRLSLDIDLLFAAKLIRVVPHQFEQPPIELIENLEIHGYLKLKMLGEIGSTNIVSIFCEILNEQELVIFDSSRVALDQIGSQAEIEYLIKNLAQQGSNSCNSLKSR
jgi:hypothetical protein